MNKVEAFEVIERVLCFYHRHMDNGPDEIELGEALEVFGQELKELWLQENAEYFLGIITGGEITGTGSNRRSAHAHPDAPWLFSRRQITTKDVCVGDGGSVSVTYEWWAGDSNEQETFVVPQHVFDQSKEHPIRVQAWIDQLWEAKNRQDADMSAVQKRREIEAAMATLRKHGVTVAPIAGS